MIIKAWWRTYNFPAIITNCSNNFGPCQNKEKFIPKIITNIKNGRKVPVYGDGKNIRDWLYVEDHVDALIKLNRPNTSKTNFCVGGNNEIENLKLLKSIILLINNLTDNKLELNEVISFVKDRKGMIEGMQFPG